MGSSVLWSVLDSFLPPFYHTASDPDLQRRGRLFVAASFCFFLIALFFGTQMAILNWYPTSNVLVMFSGCVLVVFNLMLLRGTRSTAVPGILLCLELLSIHWFEAYHDLGLRDPILIWTLVVPWLAASLVGPACGFVFGGLVILSIGSFFVFERSGHVFPAYTGPEEYVLFFVLCASTITLFLGFLGWIYERQTAGLREANQDLRGMHIDLRESNRQAEQVIKHFTDGYFTLDPCWRFAEVSRQVECLLKKSRSTLVGHPSQRYFSGYVGEDVLLKLREAVQTSRPVGFEAFYSPLHRWFDVLVCPHVGGVSIYFKDITECKVNEEQHAEAGDEVVCRAAQQGEILLGIDP